MLHYCDRVPRHSSDLDFGRAHANTAIQFYAFFKIASDRRFTRVRPRFPSNIHEETGIILYSDRQNVRTLPKPRVSVAQMADLGGHVRSVPDSTGVPDRNPPANRSAGDVAYVVHTTYHIVERSYRARVCVPSVVWIVRRVSGSSPSMGI